MFILYEKISNYIIFFSKSDCQICLLKQLMKKGETTNNINNSKKSASENGLYFINLPQLNNYSQENISQPIFHNNFTNLNDSNILDNIIPPTKQQKKFKFIQHNPIKKKSKNKKEKKISKKKINGNKQHEWNIIDNNICKHKNEISSNKYINIFSESSITTDEIYNLSNIEFECKNCKKIYHIKDLDEHIRTCILDSIKKGKFQLTNVL